MNEQDKNQLKIILTKAIDKAADSNEVANMLSPMYWGDNTIALAAEAAANVLIACHESQLEQKINS